MIISDKELLVDAKRILEDTVKHGDPFNGYDWSIVQILRRFIELVDNEQSE